MSDLFIDLAFLLWGLIAIIFSIIFLIAVFSVSVPAFIFCCILLLPNWCLLIGMILDIMEY
jgi:hypothetical protein